jgi:hypothetical protein
MDKTAQAARQARLAQALRTNLRRRKSADAIRSADRDDADPSDSGEPPQPAPSQAEPKSEF